MGKRIEEAGYIIKEGAIIVGHAFKQPYFIESIRQHSTRDLILNKTEEAALDKAVNKNIVLLKEVAEKENLSLTCATKDDYKVSHYPGGINRYAYILVYPKTMSKSEAMNYVKASKPQYDIFSKISITE